MIRSFATTFSLILCQHLAAAPMTFIDDPLVLDPLDTGSLGLGSRLGGENGPTAELIKSKRFLALHAAVQEDIRDSKTSFERVAKEYRHRPRFFNADWLKRNNTYFGLTLVTLRPDRKEFHTDSCGELRLVYRLYYRSKGQLNSDLPMTVMLKYQVPKPVETSCRGHLGSLLDGVRNAAPKSANTFFESNIATSVVFHSLEYNFQINRFPHDGSSTFSDQAHYGLGVLKPTQDSLQRSTLENTPDWQRLAKDRKLQSDLWTWLTNPTNLADIDLGHFEVPDRFLAKQATSVTSYGLFRAANRPFWRAFKPEGFKVPKSSLMALGKLKTKAGLLRRLDESSCVGCHASRSIAGFHVLGQVTNRQGYFNRMLIARSAYFNNLQSWRRDALARVDDGPTPRIPSPSRVPAGGLGSFCSNKQEDPAFTDWGCGEGFVCDLHTPKSGSGLSGLGQCVPKQRQVIGQVCDESTLTTADEPLKDTWQEQRIRACGGLNYCTKGIYGFPGGFCTTICQVSKGGGRCSQIPTLGPFTICLEKGGNFAECLKQHNTSVLMPECNNNAECRQGYVCAAASETSGICAPQYFLHQLTIENHIL